MLVIRKLQLQELGTTRYPEFEAALVRHVRLHFGDRMRAFSDESLRDLIRHCVARARSYGYRTQRDICKYLNLSLVYGPHFDRAQSWAAALLDADSAHGQPTMDELYQAGIANEGTAPDWVNRQSSTNA